MNVVLELVDDATDELTSTVLSCRPKKLSSSSEVLTAMYLRMPFFWHMTLPLWTMGARLVEDM
jgi:hypothetical protein